MMRTSTIRTRALGILIFLVFSGAANAYSITGGASPFNVYYGGIVFPQVSASATYRNFGFNFDSVDNVTALSFDFDLTNTSSIASTITGLGYNTTPNPIVDDSSATGIFPVVRDGNYPNSQGSVDLCISDANGNGSNCPGGNPTTGLQMGGTSVGNSVTIVYAGQISSINIDEFLIRYQVVGEGSDSGYGCVGGDPNCEPSTSLPEPTSLALFGIGLLGLGLRRRMMS